ncbi:MAG: shikimate dehydrogenase, partial [Candidatus Omnitrophica bacterium]|nr:shikimate dehydrogenase [Candidatus Omnitrophota bacterium]
RNDNEIWKKVDLIVNTTSVGMKEEDIALIESKNLNEEVFVYDIVYNRETALISAAKQKNIRCLNGLSMLVFQGAVSFTLWTKMAAPVKEMKKALFEFIKKA